MHKSIALVAVCCWAVVNGPSAAQPPASWKAGAAKVVITPKESLWMAGYAARNKPSEGTAQDLYAKALAKRRGSAVLV